MGIVRKQSIFNTLIYYAGVVLGYVNIIILLPMVLTPIEFGFIRLLFPFASILALFYLLGLPNVLIRFLPYYRDKKHHGGLLFFSIAVVCLATLVFTLLFFLLKGPILRSYASNSPFFVENYYYVLPLAFSIAFFELFNGYSRGQYKSVFPTFLNEMYVRLVIAAIIGIYYFGLLNFRVFLILYIGTYASTVFIMLVYLYRNGLLRLRPESEVLRKPNLRDILSFGLFSFFGAATGSLIDKIDVLFVGSYLGLVETGIYSVALLIAMSISLPYKAVVNVLYPVAAEAFRQNDFKKVREIYASSSNALLFIGSYFLIMLGFNYESFFALIQPKFLPGFYPFLIVAAARLFDMTTGINGVIITISRYFRYDLIFTSLLVLLTVTSNYVFIPRYGMVGAAVAAFFSIVLYNIVKYFFVWAKLKMQPFSAATVRISLVAAIITGIGLLLPDLENYVLDILLKSSVITGLFAVAVLMFRVSPEAHDLLSAMRQRYK
jgi:O-antigen/teichoic acid export membrane protein